MGGTFAQSKRGLRAPRRRRRLRPDIEELSSNINHDAVRVTWPAYSFGSSHKQQPEPERGLPETPPAPEPFLKYNPTVRCTARVLVVRLHATQVTPGFSHGGHSFGQAQRTNASTGKRQSRRTPLDIQYTYACLFVDCDSALTLLLRVGLLKRLYVACPSARAARERSSSLLSATGGHYFILMTRRCAKGALWRSLLAVQG